MSSDVRRETASRTSRDAMAEMGHQTDANGVCIFCRACSDATCCAPQPCPGDE